MNFSSLPPSLAEVPAATRLITKTSILVDKLRGIEEKIKRFLRNIINSILEHNNIT
jgi:hypothetical protein